MGAGVIPFTVVNGAVCFLLQTTFSGRKAGYLIDFGGGSGPAEDFRETAIREFVEETETLYFADDVSRASRTVESVQRQIPIVRNLFDETLSVHPDWWCRRAPGNPDNPKVWRTFFIEFPDRDIDALNRAWAADEIGRFKKRRELVRVAGRELLALYDHAPEKLWKRVRQLESARETISAILLSRSC